MEKQTWKKVSPFTNGIYVQELIKREVSPSAWAVLTTLKAFKGKDGCCYPSQELLSQLLGKSIRTIQRYLNELEEKNFIRVERRGVMRSNKYEILIDDKLKAFTSNYTKAKNLEKVCRENKKGTSYSYNKKQLRFNNYEQREYDMEKIEKALLGW